MKILFFILTLFFIINSVAQETIEKKIDYNHQIIEVQLQDVDLLEIDQTEENTINISMRDYTQNPSRLEIKDSDGTISIIASDILPYQESPKIDKFCYEQPLFPSYRLTIPKNCEISITYHNGNLGIHKFNGDLNFRINTGNVTIDDFDGSINGELFSGNVNANIKNTEAYLVTNQGKITTTFLTTDWEKTAISLNGTLGVKRNLLNITSIYANIVLNSATTQ